MLLFGKTHPNDHKHFLPLRSEIDGVRLDQVPESARRVSWEEKGKATTAGDVNYLDSHTLNTLPGDPWEGTVQTKIQRCHREQQLEGLNADWELP